MKEPTEVPVNLHESRWARTPWGHHPATRGKIAFACEKCVFDRGGHAPWCKKREEKKEEERRNL